MTHQTFPDSNRNLLAGISVPSYQSFYPKLPQWHRSSPSKIITGRIEKARSTHASPAYNERKRAWMGTVEGFLSRTSDGSALNLSPLPYVAAQQQYQRTTYQQRPLSWHPSTQIQQQPLSNSPAFGLMPHTTTSGSQPLAPTCQAPPTLQLPHMSQLFDSPPELYVSNGPASTSPASSVYSMDCASNPSPTFHLSTYHQSPAILDSTPMTTQSENYKLVANPYAQYPEVPKQLQLMNPLPAPSLLVPEIKGAIPAEEDEGEVLVALGLYDAPSSSQMSLLASGKSLKLAESWEPPEKDEDEEADEDEDADDDDDNDDDENDDNEAIKADNAQSQPAIASNNAPAQPSLPRIDDLTQIYHWPDTINQTNRSEAWWYEFSKQENHQQRVVAAAAQGSSYGSTTWQ